MYLLFRQRQFIPLTLSRPSLPVGILSGFRYLFLLWNIFPATMNTEIELGGEISFIATFFHDGKVKLSRFFFLSSSLGRVKSRGEYAACSTREKLRVLSAKYTFVVCQIRTMFRYVRRVKF